MSWAFVLLGIPALLLLHGFFVTAEIGAVSARRHRLVQLAANGIKGARDFLPITQNPSRFAAYVSACQVGITLTCLVLGYWSYAFLAMKLDDALAARLQLGELPARLLACTLVLGIMMSLLVLLGELVPKSLALLRPESAAIHTSGLMATLARLFRPVTFFYDATARFLLARMGLSEATWQNTHVHSPEEIQILVEESGAEGLLEEEEQRLLENTLRLRDFNARHAMIPRTQMFTASVDLPVPELLKLLAESPYSRLPLYKDSPDTIVGVVHLKDLVCLTRDCSQIDHVSQVMLPVPYVPETVPVDDLFNQLQRKHYHVAIVLDEFGGTSGMVTLEDLIERIFGDFEDEFDPPEPRAELKAGRLFLAGDVLLEDLNEWLDVELDTEMVDTVGGLVVDVRGDVPEVGAEVDVQGFPFRVERVEGKWVARVSLPLTPEQATLFEESQP